MKGEERGHEEKGRRGVYDFSCLGWRSHPGLSISTDLYFYQHSRLRCTHSHRSHPVFRESRVRSIAECYTDLVDVISSLQTRGLSGSQLNYPLLTLRLLPGRCAPFLPFIFFAEKPLVSALDSASLLFANLFLPPNPYFSSRLARL